MSKVEHCETCGAINVELFKLKHYGKACRYCKAVFGSKVGDTNERENIALMFNALEQTLRRIKEK